MVDHEVKVITAQDVERALDILPVFEAYENVAHMIPIPSLLDVYGQYTSILSGQRAAWQASFYGDDFYDGSPGSVPPRKLMPDSMQGANDPFQEMEIQEVQEVLERFCITYKSRNRVVHRAQVEVW